MILSRLMITGFNTDVPYDGQVYHVQTEDRGRKHPVLVSLVYIGGTIVAKKSTPYSEQLNQGATEGMIASLLKKQHQVIIAAIKAGRIEELIRHSAKEQDRERPGTAESSAPVPSPPQATTKAAPKAASGSLKSASGSLKSASGTLLRRASGLLGNRRSVRPSASASLLSGPASASTNRADRANSAQLTTPKPQSSTPASKGRTGGLNLDAVISDYLRRSAEQEKLDIKVLTPQGFTAGESIPLRVQISHASKPDLDATVTIKIIGTAFKPLVYVGRSGADGVANFNLVLPAFSAGTAAIVIEAQSSHGRGELKHLIRRS